MIMCNAVISHPRGSRDWTAEFHLKLLPTTIRSSPKPALEQSRAPIVHEVLSPLLPDDCTTELIDAAKLGVPQIRVRRWAGTAGVVDRLYAQRRPTVPAARALPDRSPRRYAIENRVYNTWKGGKRQKVRPGTYCRKLNNP